MSGKNTTVPYVSDVRVFWLGSFHLPFVDGFTFGPATPPGRAIALVNGWPLKFTWPDTGTKPGIAFLPQPTSATHTPALRHPRTANRDSQRFSRNMVPPSKAVSEGRGPCRAVVLNTVRLTARASSLYYE